MKFVRRKRPDGRSPLKSQFPPVFQPSLCVRNGPPLAATVEIMRLLQVEPFPHQPLQARLVEKIVGKLFIGEHGQSGAFRACG
jgi:hypothetical protein